MDGAAHLVQQLDVLVGVVGAARRRSLLRIRPQTPLGPVERLGRLRFQAAAALVQVVHHALVCWSTHYVLAAC